jgi:hypothetical protein
VNEIHHFKERETNDEAQNSHANTHLPKKLRWTELEI